MLENTRTKRLREIKEQQDSGDNYDNKGYPKNIKKRNERLLSATHCLDDYYMKKVNNTVDSSDDDSSEDEEEATKVNFKNCYLRSINYLTDERKSIQTIKSLNKLGKDGLPKFKSLPIYLINGHSSIEPRLILEPPEEMSQSAVKGERDYAFTDQLRNVGFSLHISPSTNNPKFCC